MQGEARLPSAKVAHLAADNNEARRVADLSIGAWRQVESALAPIIGQRGVAALFQRCVYLTRASHPLLDLAQAPALGPLDFALLHAALASRPPAIARAANLALLEQFLGLLGKLIGPSLADRLIAPALSPPSSGSPAMEEPP